MGEPAPVVYLLFGEDEFGISESIVKMRTLLGDPATADLNTSHLDGRSFSLDELENIALAIPFLASRRLIILTHPCARMQSKDQRTKFTQLLDRIPASTALVLVEYHKLTDDRARQKGNLHWLEEWATDASDRAYVRYFPPLTGEGMVRWILDRAKAAGGQFTTQAAVVLANLIGDDPRLADQEVDKLLAYVGYARPVEADDVETLTPSAARVKDFALVNALRKRDGRQAQAILHRQLAEENPILIFHSIVHQFRQLLLAREVLDSGGDNKEVARQLDIHPYAARLAAEHARYLTLHSLEAIYRDLLDLDEAIKTGQMSSELALDTLVIKVTDQLDSH